MRTLLNLHSLEVFWTNIIFFLFQNITLEDSEGCNSDSIVVSDAKNVSLDRSARICGTKVSQLPHTIESR